MKNDSTENVVNLLHSYKAEFKAHHSDNAVNLFCSTVFGWLCYSLMIGLDQGDNFIINRT